MSCSDRCSRTSTPLPFAAQLSAILAPPTTTTTTTFTHTFIPCQSDPVDTCAASAPSLPITLQDFGSLHPLKYHTLLNVGDVVDVMKLYCLMSMRVCAASCTATGCCKGALAARWPSCR